MRKIIVFILILIQIMFLIPILFTKSFTPKETVAQTGENKTEADVAENNYDYKKYSTIKLLHTSTNTVEEVALDEYLVHVVSAEMPVDFNEEALKAQAVVARTYTLYKVTSDTKKHENADICDSASCCQAWISKEDRLARWDEAVRQSNWNKIVNAVNSTQGKIITYEGKPINAFFHSNSGGTTEMPINVWGGSGYPYLQVVETSGEDAYAQYSSEVNLSRDELVNKVKEKHSDLVVNFEEENWIEVTGKTASGRVSSLKIGNLEIAGVEARSILGLRSTNFTVSVLGNDVKFSVIGYGHGVGMSQTGADALAKEGKNFEEIVKHFYVGVDVVDM